MRIPVVVAGLVLLLAGCAAPAPSTDAASETPTATDPTAAQAVDSTASGWIAGNHVTLTGATYDPKAATVTVSASVENLADTDSLDYHQAESIFLDTGAGAPLGPAEPSSVATQSATTSLDFVFHAPTGGLDLAGAVLQLGAPGERQWLLPLKPDADATGLEPVKLDITGVADAGGMAFNIDHAEVVPWSCDTVATDGTNDTGRVYFDTIPKDQLGLILWGDVTESQSIRGGDTLANATLTGPDGTVETYIGSFTRVFDINESVKGFPACFSVASPVKGDYTLTWTSHVGVAATFSFTVDDSIG